MASNKKGQAIRTKYGDDFADNKHLRKEGRRHFWKRHRRVEDREIQEVYHVMGLETEEQRQRFVDLATVGQVDEPPTFADAFEEAGDTLSPRERAILSTMGAE